jgi:hypothetical protein
MNIDYPMNKSHNPNYSISDKSNLSIVSYLNNKEKDKDFKLKEQMRIKTIKIKAMIEKSKNAEAVNILKQIYLNSTNNYNENYKNNKMILEY